MTDELRINATDLARLIGERDDYERAVQRAQDAEKEWREWRQEADDKYARFHRAVQEAIGWDQPGLVPEGKLLGQIRYLVTLRALDGLPPSAEEPPVAQMPLRMVRADDAMAGKGFETPPEPWAVDDLVEHRSSTPDGPAYCGRVTGRVDDLGYEGIWWNVVVTEVLNDPADTAGVMVGQSLRLREDSTLNRRLGGLDATSPSVFTQLMRTGTPVYWLSDGDYVYGTVIDHDAPSEVYVPNTMATVRVEGRGDIRIPVRRLRPAPDTPWDDQPDADEQDGPPTASMPVVQAEDDNAEPAP